MSEHRATYCDVNRFRRQMKWLKLGGYKVLALDDALATLRGGEKTKKNIVLTFDDAYENFYQNAFPILQEFGFPATVYAISSMLGKNADWLAVERNEAAKLMTAAQLREVQANGITVGSHSAHHLKLAEQSEKVIRKEVNDSKSALEDLLGASVEHFCYPYGSYNKTCMQVVKQAGYHSATTCLRAAATASFDPHALPRKAISYGDTLLGYWWKLVGKNEPGKKPIVIEPIGSLE